MEIGAGSGALAASLPAELEHLGAAPKNYFILELSPDLHWSITLYLLAPTHHP
ncbi:MAG: hypothetical protein HYU75_02555 [Betaproteobacteria bacterium]|nr:hypothetical protein [Betaproteobacteria bacterium]